MICPNCGSTMSDKKKRCERCGTDMTVYRKVYRASNQYYNNGLAKAKVRDLTGAVSSLKSGLELNKKNTNARNLLGLIYYEMGETVAALSEWVISKHFQPDENDADEYIDKVQNNPTKLDALNQAIKRYNTALTLAKQGSDDLSIIQLKKIITLNPHFIRAYQLLALLYMKNGEKEKARKYLAKANKIDVTNTTTLRYLKEIEPPVAASLKKDGNPEAELSGSGVIMPISSYREDKPNIMAYINLVIGVVIGLAVMAILVIPSIKNKQSEDSANVVDYGSELAQLEENKKTISSLQNDKSELEQKVKQLEAQIDQIEIPEDKTALYDPLLQAVQLYLRELTKSDKNRDYSSVADLLLEVDEAKLENEDVSALLSELRNTVYPVVDKQHYDTGHDLYGNGKYEEALKELAKAITFDPNDVNAIYFTARAYHRLGDNENAALYYNIVLSDYPDSDRVKTAKDFLKQVQD